MKPTEVERGAQSTRTGLAVGTRLARGMIEAIAEQAGAGVRVGVGGAGVRVRVQRNLMRDAVRSTALVALVVHSGRKW